jgi:dolichol-phosphate mannosyltransferase
MISIVTPTYNEQDNIEELYRRVTEQLVKLESRYDYEIIMIDNCSEDGTQGLLRKLAENDKNLKVIFNNRNFGHIRSPYYGILQSSGDATIYLASDLQDPPEKIGEFIEQWELGYKLVMARKPVSKSSWLMHRLRKVYYRALDGISDITLIPDSTGFGLYDKVVIDHLKQINDPYPFLRGLICELGYPVKTIEFIQPRRLRGLSKNNLYTLYDIAMLGIVSHSKVPLRIASLAGFILSFICFLGVIGYLVVKIIFWDSIPFGVAPLMITMLFMFGVNMLFIGLLGEYVASIHTYVQNRPIVVERERINCG